MVKRCTTPRNLPRSERRAQLLRCAIVVAARKGLVRMVHAEVAAEAGVSVPTVFAYFSNRRALLLAVTEEVDRFYYALARSYHHSEREPLDAVRDHLIGFAVSVDADPEYARIWLEWGALLTNEYGMWDAFLDYQERVIRMLASSIRKAQHAGAVPREVSAPDAARLIMASAYLVAQLKFMKRGPKMIHRYIEQTLHLALSDLA